MKKRPRKKWQRKTPEPHKCKQCGNVLWSTPGHTQFRGKRYCPHAPGQIPKDEWLGLRRKEAGIAPGPCNVPRNSLWRKKTRGEPRKYTCRKCGETINTGTSTGHMKWSGSIYCPNIPGQISAKEWIDERKKKDKDEHEGEEEDDDDEEEEEEEEDDEDNEDDDEREEKEEEDDDDEEDDEEDEEEDDDEEEDEDEEEEERPRKVYTCRVCNQPMKGTGHTHFRGIRYCPNAPQ